MLNHVLIDGKQYLMRRERSEHGGHIEVMRLAPNAPPTLLCHLQLRDYERQPIASSVDLNLCEAVRDGRVEEVPMQPVTDTVDLEQSRAAFADIPNPFRNSGAEYRIYKSGEIDLFYNGRLLSVGMAQTSGEEGVGKGFVDLMWDWPVVLNAEGKPDPHVPINLKSAEAGDQIARLIRFKDKVYVDAHENSPENPNPRHRVSAITPDGPRTMCTFATTHYVVEPLAPNR